MTRMEQKELNLAVSKNSEIRILFPTAALSLVGVKQNIQISRYSKVIQRKAEELIKSLHS